MTIVSDPVHLATPTPVTRADTAAWIVVALALVLIIELHLLSGLLAGLLVFKLVDVLTPWLRLRAQRGAGRMACW